MFVKSKECSRSTSSMSSSRRLARGLFPVSLLVAAASCGELSEESEPQLEMTQSAVKGEEPEGPGTMVTGDFQHQARKANATTRTGDFNGDGITDVLVSVPGPSGMGGASEGDIWTGFSNGSGNISVVKIVDSFAAKPSAVVGDFNGDGKDDLLNFFTLLTIPTNIAPSIAQSDGTGHFVYPAGPGGGWPEMPQYFLEWVRWPGGGVRKLACDINGDNKDDLVLTGPTDWDTIPVAFSNGNSTFSVTNFPSTYFHDWTEDQRARLACDDFNGDGKDDLIVMGGEGWYTVPVAFSNGDGTFNVTNIANSPLASWSNESRVQLVTGDVNGDHRADVMLTGGANWASIRLGISNGDGSFNVLTPTAYDFAAWAQEPKAMARGGDFNGDGLADITLLGGADYWYTLPIGLSTGSNTFTTVNQPVP
jgi:FG-GAP-like repeat/FG-GAP repeat